MKKIVFVLGFLILVICLNSLATKAQENTLPSMFAVFEEFVAPADLPQFESVQKEAIEIWNKIQFDIPIFSYRNDDNAFYWVVPVENFAGIDALFEKMMGMSQKLKDEGFDGDEKFRDLSTMRQTIIRWSQDLSYHPSGEFGQTEKNSFCEWTFCYMRAGHEKEASEAIKEYIKFYDSIDETYEWDVYMVMLGHDTPCWILMTRAESELALRNLESELNKMYGEKFQELWAGFSKNVRRYENKKGWFLPNWSMNVSQ